MRDKIIETLADFNDELVEDLNQDLLAEDILDSFDIVSLVMQLEEAFDITIDVDLITPDNFRTTENIVAMIEKIVGE